MNDRFKFRVWEKDQKIMKECTQITVDKDQSGSMCDVKGKVTAHLVYQPHYILMQSTGLKDKNGKLIYDGYIVKYTSLYSGNLTGEVYWDSETLQYKLKLLYSSGEVYADRDLAYFVYKNNIEVIGNVYENKELLECQSN